MHLYTLDSRDKGEQWSTPVQISRSNRDDIRNRWRPRILINPQSNRLWIFYITQNTESKQYSIGYVSRPEGSSTYNSEVQMNQRSEIIVDLAAALTKPNGKLSLHLIWTGDIKGTLTMTQMISTNNGVGWKTVGGVANGFGGPMISNIIMNPQYLYIPYLQSTGASESYMLVSTNGGSRWNKLKISNKSGLPDITLCFKAFGTKGIVFSLLNWKKSEGVYLGEFGFLDVSVMRYKDTKETPFGNEILNYDPNLSCYVENDQYTVKAIGISKGTHLYVAKYIL